MTSEEARGRAAPRVLVVENAAVVRQLVARMLRRLGCQVLEAADGSGALARCRSDKPDVMLLDWKMPVMDGLEVLRRLADGSAGPSVPKTIFCTAAHHFEIIWRALDQGADEYLMKPFDDRQLALKLRLLGLDVPCPDEAEFPVPVYV